MGQFSVEIWPVAGSVLDGTQHQGRKLSQAIYDQTDAQGLIYNSRLTGGACICIYDRALPGLVATPVVEVTRYTSTVPFALKMRWYPR